MRVFIGLAIPDDIAADLALRQGGVPGARWTARKDFHITLTFLGEADDADLESIHDALAGLRMPSFRLSLSGTGSFARGKRTDFLWVGVDAPPALYRLKEQIDQRLRQFGVVFDARKYTPHATIARVKDCADDDIAAFMQAHNLYRSRVIDVEEVVLYESLRGQATGRTEQRYRPLAVYPLVPAAIIS